VRKLQKAIKYVTNFEKKKGPVSEMSLIDRKLELNICSEVFSRVELRKKKKKKSLQIFFPTPHIFLSERRSDSDLNELCDNCKVLKIYYLMHTHTHTYTHTHTHRQTLNTDRYNVIKQVYSQRRAKLNQNQCSSARCNNVYLQNSPH